MIRKAIVAAAALLLATPAMAQRQQDQLDDRYNRALAAGYKALFLCSAIANAERNGGTRTPESVERWELTGIQQPLAGIIGDLAYRIVRTGADGGMIDFVAVAWSDDMPERFAAHTRREGCSLAPIGLQEEALQNVDRRGHPAAKRQYFPPFAEGDALMGGESLNGAFGTAYGEGTRTTAVFIVRDNTKMAERYADGFGPRIPQRTWSVAKSLAAGIIASRLTYGISEPVRLEAWHQRGDPRAYITIDNLLRMASGRYSDTPGNRTDPIYWGGSSVMENASNWPLVHEPGTVFRYANNDTLMAYKAFQQVVRQHDLPMHWFDDRGMFHTVAEQDWQGDYVISSQVWSTARDLARFGSSLLNDPLWRHTRGIEYFSAATGPQPDGRGIGYGAGFWLFNQSEGIPPDTFAAMGNRGQYIVIVPSRDVVIVRRGEDPAGTRFDIIAFTRDVLAALEED